MFEALFNIIYNTVKFALYVIWYAWI